MSGEVKQAFTPGPWHWVIHDHSCASLGVGDDPGLGTPLVMSVSPCRSCIDHAEPKEWKWGRCCTPNEADARLIAAAPELLGVLKSFVAKIDGACLVERDHPEAHLADALYEALEIIAKAEGR